MNDAERTCEVCGELATTKVVDEQEVYPTLLEGETHGSKAFKACEPHFFCDAHERPAVEFPQPWADSARYYREIAARRDTLGQTEKAEALRGVADRYEARDRTLLR